MILCGPFCFYRDYVKFIDGTNYVTPQSATSPVLSYFILFIFFCFTEIHNEDDVYVSKNITVVQISRQSWCAVVSELQEEGISVAMWIVLL